MKNILASIAGTFILLLQDFLSEAPLLNLVNDRLSKNIQISNFGTTMTILIIVILVVSAISSWIYQPQTRIDAFVRGLAVFALLGILPKSDKQPEPKPVEIKSENLKNNEINILQEASIFPRWTTASRKTIRAISHLKQKKFAPNYTIESNVWVSSCKPEVSFSGFFTNSIITCNQDKITLKEGTEVFFSGLESDIYITPIRNYKYIQVSYLNNGIIATGWIPTGKEDNMYLIKHK